MRGRFRCRYPGEPARHRVVARVVPRARDEPGRGVLQFPGGLRRVARASASGGGGRSHIAEPAVELRGAEGDRGALAGRLHPQGLSARAGWPPAGVRRGRPNAAASGFLSGIIGEPLAGRRAACPVGAATEVALISPARAIEGLLRAATATEEAWGGRSAVTLPALTVTVAD